MFSLKYIRENLDLIKKSIQAKNVTFNLDEFISLEQIKKCLALLKGIKNISITNIYQLNSDSIIVVDFASNQPISYNDTFYIFSEYYRNKSGFI